MIAENIEKTRRHIHEACARCGRDPNNILIVAVSKTKSAREVETAAAAGLRDFGENYVQELNRKRDELCSLPLRWHFIGHLQTNKVKYIAGFVHLVHSVDNVRVAEELHKRAKQHGRVLDVLIEVHTTDEPTKYGVPPGEVLQLVRTLAPLDGIKIRGLMTMGPFSDDPEDSRGSFRALRELQETIRREGIEAVSVDELSMGMTHDYEVAIEEGATILRIGTAIFGGREKP
ncbi:MAG: YggS family pyridoxal phosphate-dependent enzyme [Ignavibacteria bacterium]|nr:YggS family pyridoxal phosphate-dependent enzyme [Ignavibacteria bacterium]